MTRTLLLLCLAFAGSAYAQPVNISGDVISDEGKFLSYVSVALLHPEDSTLAYFGMTDEHGHFEIRNVAKGKFLLQSAMLGYQTFYKSIELSTSLNLGAFIMQLNPVALENVNVSGERIPLLIKKDTVEYDAGAYKTKPDAVAEELLKKLPGVEVDRSGNIKAQGEDVNQVLVDGKDFFGTDPKVATKNLPADAIKKVQVFDKKSDEAEFTGIDDGTRNRTINLLLKDNKKSAYFGDVMAGAGTGNRYQADAKLYRFTKKSQVAALGMLNNINQFGFTFKDYIDFSGGIQSLMDGEGPVIVGDDHNDFPIDFGQPQTGLITSGAGGLNYSYEPKKDNRFYASYLGNGAGKDLAQSVFTRSFTTENSFTTSDSIQQHSVPFNHRLNAGLRLKPDSSQTIIINADAALSRGNESATSFTGNFSNDSLVSTLTSITKDYSNLFSTNINGSYLKKWNSNWKVFKLYGEFSASHQFTKNEWNNVTQFFDNSGIATDEEFQNNLNNLFDYSITASITRKIGNGNYLVPQIYAGEILETLNRKQGIPPGEENTIDSLNADFLRRYQHGQVGLSFKKSTGKTHFNLGIAAEKGRMIQGETNQDKVTHDVFYLLPRASWEYDYKSGRHIMLFYESRINTPTAYQLLPVVNNSNPLQLYSGNPNLLPEYEHSLRFNWMYFDQFSFITFFAGLNSTYVHDKINWSRTVNPDLSQEITLINVSDDYRTRVNLEFSSPIRKIGANISIKINEKWERGTNLVNGTNNITTNIDHELRLTLDNRKKEKWDADAGGGIRLTDVKYSIQQSLNDHYYDLFYFADVRLTPNVHWYFSISADITQYNARGFNQGVNVPLLNAEITRYLLKSNRGVITLSAFDLLNKNTGVQRISELNYLQETRSNIIGRYVMISFKYRLNRFDDSKSGVNIQINK